MWKATVQGLLAHKLRLALTSLAIILGVTFVSGTLVLTDTLRNTFDTLFYNVYKGVDFVVREKPAFSGASEHAVLQPIPTSVANAVRAVPGVEYADGEVEGYAQFVAPNGKAVTLRDPFVGPNGEPKMVWKQAGFDRWELQVIDAPAGTNP